MKAKEIEERARFTVVGLVALICFWIIWNTQEYDKDCFRK